MSKLTKVEGYLTQQKLQTILENEPTFITTEIEAKVPNTRYRWDFLCKTKNDTIVVEFDGFQHFTKASVISNDKHKDCIAEELGYKVVRIPYWVQLNNNTFEYYFGFKNKVPIEQNYEHGFIDKKAILPADYCERGTVEFYERLDGLPEQIAEDVVSSLWNIVFDHSPKISIYEVFPLTMVNDEEAQEYYEEFGRSFLKNVNELLKSELQPKTT